MPSSQLRVLYSFPQRIGAGRVCYTAWQQARGLAAAGLVVTVAAGSVQRDVPGVSAVEPTLARGRIRIPYRALGMRRTCALHDRIVAARIRREPEAFDLVHCWPLGSLRTLEVCRAAGIPTVLERPNAYTGYAYDVVAQESARIGVELNPGDEHARDEQVLTREHAEYAAAFRLLAPSEFVVRTFVDAGYDPATLVRHTYGYDPARFWPAAEPADDDPFTVLFAGYAAVRKGLHVALDAWLASEASSSGRFLIAGGILPAYEEHLRERLSHPSVEVLGHRDDLPEIMRRSHAMTLPSFEEGFGLVCLEAMASGAIPLVSKACTDLCVHGQNAMVHEIGDVGVLQQHIDELFVDRDRRARLRNSAVATAREQSWDHAGTVLARTYEGVLDSYRSIG